MKANNDVTEAMRRTLALMQGELERSVLSAQMLGKLAPVVNSRQNLISSPRNIHGIIKDDGGYSRHPHKSSGHLQTAHHRAGKDRLDGPPSHTCCSSLLRACRTLHPETTPSRSRVAHSFLLDAIYSQHVWPRRCAQVGPAGGILVVVHRRDHAYRV